MKKIICLIVCVLMVVAVFAACAQEAPATEEPAAESSAVEETATEEPAAESSAVEETVAEETATEEVVGDYPEFDVNEASTSNLTTVGPDGEATCGIDDLEFTDEELAQIKDGGFKVAFCYHELEDMHNNAKLNGAKAKCEELGIEVVAVTDAGFSVEQQASDIESVLALNPDVVFIMPIDADAIGPSIEKINASGATACFMEMHGNNLTEGVDYCGTVANDFYGVGVGCAHMIAKAMNYEGTVAMCFYDYAFYATNQRDEGFKDTMAKFYPNIEIVMEIGFTDANDTDTQGNAIFAAYPDVTGVYASWDIPLEGIISAAKAAGRDDLICVTPDLSDNTARRIAEGDMVCGSAAPQAYRCGQAEVMMAAYHCIGKIPPAYYCSVPAQYIQQSNLAEAYHNMYNADLPAEIQAILDKNK